MGNKCVEITPLIFKCKSCKEGHASYTFTTIYESYKFSTSFKFGDKIGSRKPDVPPILNKLTTVLAECDVDPLHENTYQVAFFKCSEPGCSEYVMATNDAIHCEDKIRIFNNKGQVDLTCTNDPPHKHTYILMR